MPSNTTAKRAPVGWMALAFAACPCHLPLVGVAFAGTAAGAWLAENLALTLGATGVPFVLALRGLWRQLAGASDASPVRAWRSPRACVGVPPPEKR